MRQKRKQMRRRYASFIRGTGGSGASIEIREMHGKIVDQLFVCRPLDELNVIRLLEDSPKNAMDRSASVDLRAASQSSPWVSLSQGNAMEVSANTTSSVELVKTS